MESPDKTRAFIRGYLRGLDWALDPANREAAESLLQSRMPEIKPQGMKAVIKSVMSPASGLTPEAQILPDGMQTVLDLRSRYGSGSEALSDPERYLDLSCYHAVTGKA